MRQLSEAAAICTSSVYDAHSLRGPQQTRVIDLEPVKNSFLDPIRCSMRVIEIPPADDKSASEFLTPYEALSYAWGSSRKEDMIWIDDVPLEVTSNLAAALRRLRQNFINDESHSRTFWIDAISINQDDYEERAQQVAMMRGIFVSTIWLGEIPDRKLHDLYEVGVQAFMDEAVKSPWFRRRWVLQEFLLSDANSLYVQYGYQREEYETFRMDLLFCQPRNRIARESFLELNPFDSYGGLMLEDQMNAYGRQRDELPSLLTNLLCFRKTECSDPMDRVHALLGISNPDHPILQVDYSRNLRDMYMDIARHFVYRNSLEVLCAATMTSHAPGCGLPSWVPNWSQLQERRDQDYKECMEHIIIGSRWKKETEGLIVNMDGTLQVWGWVIKACQHEKSMREECLCCRLLDFTSGPRDRLATLERLLWIKNCEYGFVVQERKDPEGFRLVSCFKIRVNFSYDAGWKMEKLHKCTSIKIV